MTKPKRNFEVWRDICWEGGIDSEVVGTGWIGEYSHTVYLNLGIFYSEKQYTRQWNAKRGVERAMKRLGLRVVWVDGKEG